MRQTGTEMIAWPTNFVTVLSIISWNLSMKLKLKSPARISILIHVILYLQGIGKVELWRLWNPVWNSIATKPPVEGILMHVQHNIEAILLCIVDTSYNLVQVGHVVLALLWFQSSPQYTQPDYVVAHGSHQFGIFFRIRIPEFGF